ncbi:sugar ABC transporter ATP-binding protein [Capillimicrobium parvum]|uniref:Ribose import ATP-binding protein RbsA n=1 Tax=Capillimicrobium parvum TaxID=2884022 RepID=A0A9E6XTV6_9ACTN|nr:sugar ABC transporter ATP-binding protein [Capillimicrobium parvum]UGS34385.1 Ribose import ATP-binding protein RbsA [Capillimicrobium parvum]
MDAGTEAVGAQPVLRILGVEKTFGATVALGGVSFDLARGSVHALLGGNGSGKSTMIKILAGVYHADAGELELQGARLDARAMTPARAHAAGLRFVHQQQSTFPEMTVAENLAIGHGFDTDGLSRIRWRALRRRAREILDRYGIDADPRTELGRLSPASQAMVAIARALQDQDGEHEGVLVLDEPTASLPAGEVELLLSAIKRYAAAGQAILFVTHRLEEVLRAADRATVLRDGQVVTTVERAQMDHGSLVELIMGRRVEQALTEIHPVGGRGQVVMRAQGLAGGPIQEVSFAASAGEIVGLAGLLGSGRSSVLRMLFGAGPVEAGAIELDGRSVRFTQPRQAMAAGVAYTPEDRLSEAAFADMSVAENLGIATTGRYFRRGRLRHRAERRDARALAEAYHVKAASVEAPFSSMSGGNQQKVVLARWMRRDPRLLLLDEPTQGVDVGSRAEIWQLVRGAVEAGAAAIVVSSDMEELPRVCDRVLVLRDGRIAAEVGGAELTEERLNHLLLTPEVTR